MRSKRNKESSCSCGILLNLLPAFKQEKEDPNGGKKSNKILVSSLFKEDSALENESPSDFGGSDSDRALSLWAPILLGMISNPRRRSRLRHLEFDDDDEEERDNHTREGDDPELASRRRRNSATILHLLQGIRVGMENVEGENTETGRESSRDREHVILINPFNQTIIVQGSYDSDNNNSRNQPIGSLGDYFIGPGLDMLLQHLAENDPNRYGTPPAQKNVVEALPEEILLVLSFVCGEGQYS
ncbi:hypothetical protein K7X08_035865 [Anisodus acutangulus]|uniref:Uncharacterized protein n=1 Tax=Anisodus acutangulus TaxID=402998 RepID=A0A9Q1QUC7_9SOLA|nr:hypothetical protein K7X08_035865 [Anisodus acutangulus]